MLTKLYTLEYYELDDSIDISITPQITQTWIVKQIIHRHHPDDRQTCVYGIELESVTETK